MNRDLPTEVVLDVETKVEDVRNRGGHLLRAIRYAHAMSPILALVGVACWRASITQLHPYSVGELGLASQLSILWWLGLLFTVLAVTLELIRESPRLLAMGICLISLILVLHGTLPAAEVTPRLDATYDVAGFADFVGRHGRTQPYLDARMSWPGMLSGTAMLARAMHVPTLWFARWAPVFLNLSYLVPIKAIANVSLKTSRARWAALPIFLAANWIDQDYFSPQGIDLFLYLTIVAMAIRTFGTRGEQPKLVRWVMTARPYREVRTRLLRVARLPRRGTQGELMVDGTTAAQRVAFVGLAFLLIAALVVSHQFTPLASCVVLLALSLAGRTRLKSLWLFVGILTFAWLSWEARIYWAGHLGVIFGGVGHVGTSLGTSVTTRFGKVSSGRLDVQRARLLASFVTWFGGVVGFYMLWRRGRSLWTLAIVMVAPLVVAVGVNYGGEVVLRILLFSLAPCSIFIAGLVDGTPQSWTRVVPFIVVVTTLVVLFPLTRYGNESFEAMAPADVAAATWIHANVPNGSTIWVANDDNPLNSEHIGRYTYDAPLPGPPLTSVRSYEIAVRHVHPGSWIYLDRSQEEYAIVDQGGYPQQWMEHFAQWLVSSGHARIAHRTSTAYVFQEISSGR